MAIIQLRQGSTEWLRWRLQGITATESSIVMQRDEDTTPFMLYQQKKGLAVEACLNANPHVRRGKREEPIARQILSARWGETLQPVCMEWDRWRVIRASLDCRRRNGEPVEIKHPCEIVFEDVRLNNIHSVAFQRHFIQVQQQILVTQAKQGWLVFRCGNKMEIFCVPACTETLRLLVQSCRQFWQWLATNTPPPQTPADYYLPSTQREANLFTEMAEQYFRLHNHQMELEAKISSLETAKNTLKDGFSSLMGIHRRSEFAGLSIVKSTVKGSIDWKQAYFASKPGLTDAERFRKSSRNEVKITATGRAVPARIVDPKVLDLAANAANSSIPKMHFSMNN